MTVTAQLKVAILINGISAHTDGIKATFVDAITTASPGAKVDFYDPIEAQTYPNQEEYDLIVLSGGTADPMSKDVPWVLKMQEFLRTTVKDHPKQKIVGICWGHQTINITFGGLVGPTDKAEIGITTIPLTTTGSSFFASYLPLQDQYDIHEYHGREVKTPGKGFIALAEGNQCFVNPTNTILTFQGHPEKTAEIAQKMFKTVPPYMGVDAAEKEEIARKMLGPHDGLTIWKRVVAWVGEA